MNIVTKCEICKKDVILTSSYNGQPIICLKHNLEDIK